MTKLPLSKASLQCWHDKGQFLTLLDQEIFVIDEGQKNQPVVVLIHGFPTSSWDWAPIWDSLRANYRLVCLDMLGFGFSDKPDHRNYSIHGQADLVEALVEQLQLSQFHVLAHDYGDTVAQELLARQLDGSGIGHWLSCCFLNGGLFPETHQALLIQKLMLSPLGKWINKFTGFAQFSDSFSRVFGEQTKPTQEQLEEFWELINFNNGRHVFHNLITYMRDRRQHRQRWVGALQHATLPLALINGSVDPVSGSHMVARYQELECRLDHLAELKQVGHYPQVEAPVSVAESYLSFLSGISDQNP